MIKYKSSGLNVDKFKYEIVILPIGENGLLGETAKMMDRHSGGKLSKQLKLLNLGDKTSFIQALNIEAFPNTHILYMYIPKTSTLYQWTQALANLNRACQHLPTNTIFCALHEMPMFPINIKLQQLVLAFEQMFYQFEIKPSKKPLVSITFSATAKNHTHNFKSFQMTAEAITRTKNIANLPGNLCTPGYLVKLSKKIATEHKGLSTKAYNEPALKKLGFRTLLAVGQGSAEHTYFIEMHYKGKSQLPPIILIGKGITFDTGGISIKQKLGMDSMKYDMCGASSVIATMEAIAKLKLPLHVIGLIPTAENMPDGKAIKPGDVIKTYQGKTVEILNTDAEGRLILCDAIAYAKRFKPAHVIDVATLTGSIIMALGHHYGGLFANNDKLAKSLIKSSESCQEPLWRMPMHEAYAAPLQSLSADLANIGVPEAGCIQAAMFLDAFAKDLSWAHLDIAGTAMRSTQTGATGSPSATLVQWLIDQAEAPI